VLLQIAGRYTRNAMKNGKARIALRKPLSIVFYRSERLGPFDNRSDHDMEDDCHSIRTALHVVEQRRDDLNMIVATSFAGKESARLSPAYAFGAANYGRNALPL
jgi:hypothetical protein